MHRSYPGIIPQIKKKGLTREWYERDNRHIFLSRTNLQNTTALVETLSRLTENGNHLSLLTDPVDPGRY